MKIRRPGNLGNTQYPVRESLATRKLREINLINHANKTPLTNGQINQRLLDHLRNPRRLSQMT